MSVRFERLASAVLDDSAVTTAVPDSSQVRGCVHLPDSGTGPVPLPSSPWGEAGESAEVTNALQLCQLAPGGSMLSSELWWGSCDCHFLVALLWVPGPQFLQRILGNSSRTKPESPWPLPSPAQCSLRGSCTSSVLGNVCRLLTGIWAAGQRPGTCGGTSQAGLLPPRWAQRLHGEPTGTLRGWRFLSVCTGGEGAQRGGDLPRSSLTPEAQSASSWGRWSSCHLRRLLSGI